MKRETNILFKVRAAMLLLVMVLTTATAWADDPNWLKSGDAWDATTNTLTVNSDVAGSAYRNRTEIEHLVINNGEILNINQYAFAGCTGLEAITCTGTEALNIDYKAFEGCTSLTAFFFPLIHLL